MIAVVSRESRMSCILGFIVHFLRRSCASPEIAHSAAVLAGYQENIVGGCAMYIFYKKEIKRGASTTKKGGTSSSKMIVIDCRIKAFFCCGCTSYIIRRRTTNKITLNVQHARQSMLCFFSVFVRTHIPDCNFCSCALQMGQPKATRIDSPLMPDDSSDARNTIAWATSSGATTRFAG